MMVGYVMVSKDLMGSAMDVDHFQWGEPTCDGLAAGIAIEKNAPNVPIVYHIALANRSASSRQITLFSTAPGLYRLRVIGRQGAVEVSAPALYSHLQVTNPQVKFTEVLAPGQIFQHPGDPTRFRGELFGTGTLHIVFSSLSVGHDAPFDEDRWCHVNSPAVAVEFYPMGSAEQPTP
jgi:hypothetical protein